MHCSIFFSALSSFSRYDDDDNNLYDDYYAYFQPVAVLVPLVTKLVGHRHVASLSVQDLDAMLCYVFFEVYG